MGKISEMLKQKKDVEVYTIQPLCIYTKDQFSESCCWDNVRNSELNPDFIDDSYGLDVVEDSSKLDNITTLVYIPKGAKCTLKNTVVNVECTVYYKNIECDLVFEDEIEDYFEIDSNQ